MFKNFYNKKITEKIENETVTVKKCIITSVGKNTWNISAQHMNCNIKFNLVRISGLLILNYIKLKKQTK